MPDPVEIVVDYPDPIITDFVVDRLGPAGQDGVGIPVGGTTGQYLQKASNTNFDTQWATGSGGGGTWGTITGTLSSQTDLQSALDAKVPTSRTVNGHALSANVTVTDTDLGATTIGDSMFKLTNPSAITFPRFNANNTVSALSDSAFRTAIGAGTSSFDGLFTSLNFTGSDLTSIATRNFSDLQNIPTTLAGYGISDAALDNSVVHLAGTESISGAKTFSNNVTLSDKTKTLLIGASSVPDISGLTDIEGFALSNGAEVMITTRYDNPGPQDNKAAFMVLGDFRAGSSGDRYNVSILPTGSLFTNASVALWGHVPPTSITPLGPDSAYMLSMSMDVPIGISMIPDSGMTDTSGARIMTGWGPPGEDNTPHRNYEQGTQGTLRLFNWYSSTGSTAYTKPAIILADIGQNWAIPSWTYGSVRQYDGHTYIGTYNNSTNAQGNEIDVTSGVVTLKNNVSIPATTGSSTGVLLAGSNRLLHTYGTENVFLGITSGNFTLTGSGNSGFGLNALTLLTSGSSNSSVGRYAGEAVTTGSDNTAMGDLSLRAVTTQSQNSAFGTSAMRNATGNYNSALGNESVRYASGDNNVGVGIYSLSSNPFSGSDNVGIGYAAGGAITSGDHNTLIGSSADVSAGSASYRTAIGAGASATTNNTIVLGRSADTVVIPGSTALNTTGSAASLSISGQTGLLTFTGLASTNRIKAVADSADTLAEWGKANTFTAANIISTSGAASTPALKISGVPFAGTGTTSFPLFYINDANATASTTLNTAGTYFGVNAHTGIGNLVDMMLDGATKFKVTSAGAGTFESNLTTNASFNLGGASNIQFQARSRILSSSNGLIEFLNNGQTDFTGINFGGTSNSFSRIGRDAVNGFTLQSAAGTATWNDASTAGSGTVANRYLFGIAAPTLTATNASVTDTVASTVYIGGAPTASTNTTIGTPYALNVASGVTNLAGPVILKSYTVATLPSTAATGQVTGAVAIVTDALAPTFLGALTGGSSTVTPVFYNGSAWVSY